MPHRVRAGGAVSALSRSLTAKVNQSRRDTVSVTVSVRVIHSSRPTNTGNVHATGTLRSLVTPRIRSILEPQIEILRDQGSALHHGGTDSDEQISDPELIESCEKCALTGLEQRVDHGEATSEA